MTVAIVSVSRVRKFSEGTFVVHAVASVDETALRTVEVGVTPTDDDPLVVAVRDWMAENDGSYTVEINEPPTPEQQRAMLPDLEKWRVDSIIDLTTGLRDQINAAIDGLEEPTRTVSRNKLQSVAMFSRADPLFSTIGAAVGLTDEQIDAMWTAAASL